MEPRSRGASWEADRAGCKRTRAVPNCASRPLHGQRRTALNVGGTRNPPLGREFDPALTFVDGFSCLPVGNWDSWSPPSHRLLFGRLAPRLGGIARSITPSWLVSRAPLVSSSRSDSGCATAGSAPRADRAASPRRSGQITALVGTYAVLVQLLLMSRIAWLERAIGLDRLAVWHRWIGFATVWLLSAHVVFTTIGYAQADNVSLWYADARLRLALSRCADGLGRVRALHRGRGHFGARGAAQAGAADVVLRASVRVPRDRAHVRASARGRD